MHHAPRRRPRWDPTRPQHRGDGRRVRGATGFCQCSLSLHRQRACAARSGPTGGSPICGRRSRRLSNSATHGRLEAARWHPPEQLPVELLACRAASRALPSVRSGAVSAPSARRPACAVAPLHAPGRADPGGGRRAGGQARKAAHPPLRTRRLACTPRPVASGQRALQRGGPAALLLFAHTPPRRRRARV